MENIRKAIIVGVNLKNQDADFEHSMKELKGLAVACNRGLKLEKLSCKWR